jgi:hypothetical protein
MPLLLLLRGCGLLFTVEWLGARAKHTLSSIVCRPSTTIDAHH